jgi:RNA polymerase sigma-70 factor (ECF subfamily)
MDQGEKQIRQYLHHEKWDLAFDLVVEHFSKPLYFHIRKLVVVHADADDVLQNSFIKIWQNLARFRGDSKLYTWLYRIATNEALAHLRRERKRQKDMGPEALAHLRQDPYLDCSAAEKEMLAALSQLPEKQQAVFKLRYFDDMPYQDMAALLKTSVGGLKANYHHARRKLEPVLTKSLNLPHH